MSSVSRRLLYKLLCGSWAIVILAYANTYATDAKDSGAPAQTTIPARPSLERVRVQRANMLGTEFAEAGIGDILVVKVKFLKDLVDYAKCYSDDGKERTVPNCTEQKIALFLDGREIKGIFPISGAPRPEDETLQFRLQRDATSDEVWADLLGGPPLDSVRFYKRDTAVSVGLENAYALPSEVKAGNFRLIRIHKNWFIFCLIVLVVELFALIWLALYSELLRDVGPLPLSEKKKKGWIFAAKKIHKPYSISRFQMAFWFFLVVPSFLFIWLINGAFDTITSTVLGLIGIGAGTALGAAAVDIGKSQGDKTTLQNLQAEQTTLTNDITALGVQIKAPPPTNLDDLNQVRKTKQDRLNLIQSQIATLQAATSPKESDWFLNDILTDETNGISFHRFQMFVWTLVLGILFLYSVWYRLSMPDFSATLLALLGISSGTYLGFKIPEKQT
jgi:hypothetical protein